MAIMELNMTQELADIYQEPLFLVFLYLREEYDNLDPSIILQTLMGYRAGPKMGGLLA